VRDRFKAGEIYRQPLACIRTVKPIPPPPTTGLRYRIQSLVGITSVKMMKYRISWKEAIISPFDVVWRPQIFGILVFEVSRGLHHVYFST
jgi:hypothetical protein